MIFLIAQGYRKMLLKQSTLSTLIVLLVITDQSAISDNEPAQLGDTSALPVAPPGTMITAHADDIVPSQKISEAHSLSSWSRNSYRGTGTHVQSEQVIEKEQDFVFVAYKCNTIIVIT